MALWQPLAVCDIKDPRHHETCVGTTKKGEPCRSRVSRDTRKSAWDRLETLSLFSVSLDHAKTVLESVAHMLLCKRLHRGQSGQVSEEWFKGIKNNQPSQSLINTSNVPCPTPYSPPMGSRVSSFVPLSVSDDDVGVIDLTHGEEPSAQHQNGLTPRGDAVREVAIEALKQNDIPFKVSSSRLAAVCVRTVDGRTESVILRSFRSRRISGVYCSICHSDEPAGNISISCEECSCDFHWGCIERWLSDRSRSAQHACPHCQMICHFDGLYLEEPASPPLPMPEVRTSRPLTPTTDAIPMDVSEPTGLGPRLPSHPLPLRPPAHVLDSMTAQSASPASSVPTDRQTIPDAAITTTRTTGSRRSGRQTRRPNYFVPS